jgi:lipoprotein-releasing system ATP-binding protein
MIIQATDLKKSYYNGKNATEVIKGINLDVHHGEYLALVGPSGAGKSTLLYLISSLEKTDSGKILFNLDSSSFNIIDLNKEKIAEIRNKYIGFIFQFHHLMPEFNALENVMIPGMIAGTAKAKLKEKALYLLDKVGVSHRLDHKPSELSGGEQQRVAIARSLINNPKILFADEPTGNLDTKNSESFLELISTIKKEYNLTVVTATHSKEIAAAADRIVTIEDGYIKE